MSVTVFGSVNMDLVVRVPSLPRPGETVAGRSIDYFPGGKGGNQAVASARFGAVTRLIGAAGTDAHGEAIWGFLRGAGIDTAHVALIAGPTGLAQICVADNGENQIAIVGGANSEVVAPASWDPVWSTGHPVALTQLELPMGQVDVFLKQARNAGATTVLNVAPALSDAKSLFGNADVLVMNETELAYCLGCDTATTATTAKAAASAARALVQRPGQYVVVTLGAAGVVIVGEADPVFIPAVEVSVVDTTGAGDCFCGVLAAGMSEGLTIEAAARLGVKAAGISVQRSGAAASMPMRAEIEDDLLS